MAIRKVEDQNVRKLAKIGKQSVGLTLPIEMVRDLGWRLKQRVRVTRIKGGLVIRDYHSKY